MSTEEKHKQELDDDNLPGPCQETLQRISAHTTKPGTTVFVDTKNNNAWISSNLRIETLD